MAGLKKETPFRKKGKKAGKGRKRLLGRRPLIEGIAGMIHHHLM
jgi:hypothetical protein